MGVATAFWQTSISVGAGQDNRSRVFKPPQKHAWMNCPSCTRPGLMLSLAAIASVPYPLPRYDGQSSHNRTLGTSGVSVHTIEWARMLHYSRVPVAINGVVRHYPLTGSNLP